MSPAQRLGPAAQPVNINRGNLFDHPVSIASKPLCLHEFAVRGFGSDSPQVKLDVAMVGGVSSLIRTSAGQTILDVDNMNSP